MNPLNLNMTSSASERSAQDIITPAPEIKAASDAQRKLDVNNKQVEQASESAEVRAQFFADLQQNLQKLNEVFPLTTTNLSFEFDKTGSESFIRVIDRDNQKVIREIPSEEFRKVAKALDEFADNFRSKGLIFDRTA